MTCFDSAALQTLAGITPRQMNHWLSRGWLEPLDRQGAGSGVPIAWPERSANKAVLMGRLVRAGFIPMRAHQVAEACLNDVNVSATSRGFKIGEGVYLRLTLSNEKPGPIVTYYNEKAI
jgi:hypothetical protein